LSLSYPPPGSVNVATNIGQLVVSGFGSGYAIYTISTALTAGSGSSVPLGAFGPVPSPLPSPFATRPRALGGAGYNGLLIAALSPNTSYALSQTVTTQATNPPTCSVSVTQQAGSFTTGN